MHFAAFLIYYLSFLLFPTIIWAVYKIISPKFNWKYLALSLFLLIGIYARFIEPQIIQIHTTQIHIEKLKQPIKIAIIADPQFGVYKGQFFAKRLVKKIQSQHPQYTFIAGDITYKPKFKQVDKYLSLLSPLTNTYAVLGNHDYLHIGVPSDKLSQAIISKFTQLHIPVIDNKIIQTPEFNLIGYGSLWANNFNQPPLDKLDPKKIIISLMHNPDGTYIPNTLKSDLTIAGHTHCGQIRIPFTYKYTYPTDRVYKKGLQNSLIGPLFISCGLGESLLPLRLFNPPTIDILELY